ncbi:hypothetical protein CAEBREN_17128 [Caenorhabditis brenneri]|uniref:SAM-dependent MTase TRM10-type domain-containing protein n=1 Tax=Caenorhabditis brenneri TaxID=135651 RepID=G0MJG6_CAEBE|nr:hypothetical protein CAEBREN_17128 [Caenorhabditis brenneri]
MYARVRRPGQKAHFVQVASEIELLKDVYGMDTLKSLNITDNTWQILMEMSWEERYTYLLDCVKFRRKSEEKPAENEELISSRNQERLEAGEMVYARGFHSILDIYGSDFRQRIDNFYGRNVMKQGDDLKHFIVDCRFLREFSVKTQAFFTNQMQALHDANWTSDLPFSISFANYQADQQLSSIAKRFILAGFHSTNHIFLLFPPIFIFPRNLLFQYGPPSKASSSFRRHPFAPLITSRRIDAVERKENLLYISPRATQYLPDTVPENIRGVVVCLSQDAHPSTSSLSASINDKVPAYRVPFKRVISSDKFRENIVRLAQMPQIFRPYFQGVQIDDCIRQFVRNRVTNQYILVDLFRLHLIRHENKQNTGRRTRKMRRKMRCFDRQCITSTTVRMGRESSQWRGRGARR